MSDIFDEIEGAVAELEQHQEVSLGDVGRLANNMVAHLRAVDQAEQDLKKAKEELRSIQEELLPQAMTAMGLSQLKLESGEKLTVSNYYQASVKVEDRAAS